MLNLNKTKKQCKVTYIVQHNANEDVERDTEEIQNGAPCLFWDVLRSHLHNRWPENTHTSLKGTEPDKLKATRK